MKLKRLPVAAALLAVTLTPCVAETLRCRSVNGNTVCAGSGGVSCQTVNGRTTCIGGGGATMQQFGSPRDAQPQIEMEPDIEEGMSEPDGTAARPRRVPGSRRLSIERLGPGGWLLLERDGTRLRLRSEGLAIDRE